MQWFYPTLYFFLIHYSITWTTTKKNFFKKDLFLPLSPQCWWCCGRRVVLHNQLVSMFVSECPLKPIKSWKPKSCPLKYAVSLKHVTRWGKMCSNIYFTPLDAQLNFTENLQTNLFKSLALWTHNLVYSPCSEIRAGHIPLTDSFSGLIHLFSGNWTSNLMNRSPFSKGLR